MTNDWENTRTRIFDLLGQHKQSIHSNLNTFKKSTSSFDSSTQSIQLTPKMKQYSKVTQELNQARLKTEDYGLITMYSLVAEQFKNGDASERQLLDCWKLLSLIVGENNVSKQNGRFQKQKVRMFEFKRGHVDAQVDGEDDIKFREQIVKGGREFLSNHFWDFAEKAVQHTRAIVGGLPKVSTIIDAFITIRFKKFGNWQKPYLDITTTGKAIWVHLFYLVRSGHFDDAVKFCQGEMMKEFDLRDPNFVQAFCKWAFGKGVYQVSVRNSLEPMWNQYVRDSVKLDRSGHIVEGDPFKMALYKLLGRFELNRKTIPGPDVLPSTEDYLWFHLFLTSERPLQTDPIQNQYTLPKMSQLMKKFGSNHFSNAGRQPVMWAFILFLCGEFEQAVHYLYQSEGFKVEAVHFGIGLAYYGLLRVPESPLLGEAGVRILNSKVVGGSGGIGLDGERVLSSVNFFRVLSDYAKSFFKTGYIDALNYLFVAGIFGVEVEYSGGDDGQGDGENNIGGQTINIAGGGLRRSDGKEDYSSVTYSVIVDFVVENIDKIDELLGQVREDGSKLPGYLEKSLKLVHINRDAEFLGFIVKAAARRCDLNGKFEDTIRLFDLAGEYETVLKLVNKKLAEKIVEEYGANNQLFNTIPGGGGDVVGGSFSPFKLSASSSKVSNARLDEEAKVVDKVFTLAKEISNRYFSQAIVLKKIQIEKRQGLILLLKINDFFKLFLKNNNNNKNNNNFEKATNLIEQLQIFPSKDDQNSASKKALEIQNLDENILKVLPALLIAMMKCYFELTRQASVGGGGIFGGGGSNVVDNARKERVKGLQVKGKGLVLFAANVMYKMPGDVYGQLVKLEAAIGFKNQ